MPSLGDPGIFGAAVCAKMFSSVCTLNAYKLEDNSIWASVLMGLSNERYFLGDFYKNFPWFPLCTFTENAGLGDLAKLAITWPFGHS